MGLLRRLLEFLQSRFQPEVPPHADPPDDPYADRLVPVQRGPGSLSGAVALEEPDDED
ncbi:MAG TPA: hypothetical protein VLE48_07670 [Terriglobales bacterium]|nr:hypothetical protein [Terriglobales bacterium]